MYTCAILEMCRLVHDPQLILHSRIVDELLGNGLTLNVIGNSLVMTEREITVKKKNF